MAGHVCGDIFDEASAGDSSVSETSSEGASVDAPESSSTAAEAASETGTGAASVADAGTAASETEASGTAASETEASGSADTAIQDTSAGESAVEEAAAPAEQSVLNKCRFDLKSDYNDFMGRNYTARTDGVIPDGSNLGLYTDSTLAKVYISYDGEDINDSSVVGYISLSEQISQLIYYKYYPIKGSGNNKYLMIPLIDNPYADRPNDKAFNGWVTNYDGAEVILDTDVYVRYLKVPVASNYAGEVININMDF